MFIAQNLNASSASFASAVMGGDATWIADLAGRLVRSGADALDLCVSSVAPDVETEVRLLDWVAETVEAVTDLPLCLDSARGEVLLRCRRPRRTVPILNSLACDGWRSAFESVDEPERESLRWVVQLRGEQGLPQDEITRLQWTEQCLAEIDAVGPSRDRFWLDPICLPWGADLEAGSGLLGFLAEAGRRWPDLRILVALGNLSWGHVDRPGIHDLWLPRLRDLGVDCFLADPLEPGLPERVRS